MNRKIVYSIAIGILILSVVSATIITSSQLSQVSNSTILQTMTNSFEFQEGGMDYDDDYYYQQYQILIIEPMPFDEGNYIYKNVSIKGIVRFEDYNKCLENETSSYCISALTTGSGYEYLKDGEMYLAKSINQQLMDQGMEHYYQIIVYRDESQSNFTASSIGSLSF